MRQHAKHASILTFGITKSPFSHNTVPWQVWFVLQALEWVANNHRPPAVLSMSVAGQLSLAINEAVRRLVETYMITVGSLKGTLLVSDGLDCM